jgi:hypothetical protein
VTSTFIIVAAAVVVALAIAAAVKLRRDDRLARDRVENADDSSVTDWQADHQEWRSGLPADIRDAHTHSSKHRSEVLASRTCGCFYCGQIFEPSQIEDWCDPTDDDEAGTTAICPFCGIDSVIGDRSGYPITAQFLSAMKSHWF